MKLIEYLIIVAMAALAASCTDTSQVAEQKGSIHQAPIVQMK